MAMIEGGSVIGGVYEKIGFFHRKNIKEVVTCLKTSDLSKNFWLSVGL
jgi:hypothetical protein